MIVNREKGEKAELGIPTLCRRSGPDKYNTGCATVYHGRGSSVPQGHWPTWCHQLPGWEGCCPLDETQHRWQRFNTSSDSCWILHPGLVGSHSHRAWAGGGSFTRTMPNPPKYVCKLLLRESFVLKWDTPCSSCFHLQKFQVSHNNDK